MTSSPCARANSSEVTTSADAPSLRLEALPAVTLSSTAPTPFDPFGGNAGRSLASDSVVVSLRGPSSALMTDGPFLDGISPGTLSSANFPASAAATARW